MINDNQSFNGAKTEWGTNLRTWDAGYGQLWIHRESMGISGIVRADTWENAYECVLDEILQPVPEDELKELEKEWKADGHNFDEGLPEGYRYQSNFTGTGVVSLDLNGDYLDILTAELAKALGLTLDIQDEIAS